MFYKEYEANTEQEALEKAKAELGPDATITHITKIKPKGFFKLFKKPIVKVTVSIDNDVDYTKKPINSSSSKNNYPYEKTAADFVKMSTGASFDKIIPKEDDSFAVEQVLDSLQNMLGKQVKEMPNIKSSDNLSVAKQELKEEENPALDVVKMIYNKLITNEVEEIYANTVIGEIQNHLKPDSDVKNILSQIYQKIILKLGETKTLDFVPGQNKYVFFIGPTGVGKTTTIAKLASTLKLNHKAKVALFTSDTYRIAAVDQLRNYANILNIPLKVIYSETDMRDAMEDFKDYDIILFDTAGRSHKSKEQRDDIEKLILSVPKEKREVYLVLSATTKYRDLVNITECYKEISDYSLIFTKLDETDCIGNIFNIRLLTNMPLAYSTNGQNVPDDIAKIDPQCIAKQLLGGK